MRYIFAVLAFVCLQSGGQAQEPKPELPKTSIEFGSVRFVNDAYEFTKVLKRSVFQEESYTVQVPYTVETDTGTETKMAVETRTRVVPVTVLSHETISLNAKDVVLASAAGGRVKAPAMIARVLASQRPAVLTSSPPPLEAFYAKLLKANVIVLHVNPKVLADSAAAEPSPAEVLPAPLPYPDTPPSPADAPAPPAPAPEPIEVEQNNTFDDLFGAVTSVPQVG